MITTVNQICPKCHTPFMGSDAIGCPCPSCEWGNFMVFTTEEEYRARILHQDQEIKKLEKEKKQLEIKLHKSVDETVTANRVWGRGYRG